MWSQRFRWHGSLGRVWKQCLEKHQGTLWGHTVVVRVRATSFQPTSIYHSGLEVVTQTQDIVTGHDPGNQLLLRSGGTIVLQNLGQERHIFPKFVQ